MQEMKYNIVDNKIVITAQDFLDRFLEFQGTSPILIDELIDLAGGFISPEINEKELITKFRVKGIYYATAHILTQLKEAESNISDTNIKTGGGYVGGLVSMARQDKVQLMYHIGDDNLTNQLSTTAYGNILLTIILPQLQFTGIIAPFNISDYPAINIGGFNGK